MTLTADRTTDLTILFDTDELAVAATYTVRGAASGSSITVVPEYGPHAAALDWQAQESRMANMMVKTADVAAPVPGDSITIGSYLWVVQGVVNGDGYMWRLAVVNRT